MESNEKNNNSIKSKYLKEIDEIPEELEELTDEINSDYSIENNDKQNKELIVQSETDKSFDDEQI